MVRAEFIGAARARCRRGSEICVNFHLLRLPAAVNMRAPISPVARCYVSASARAFEGQLFSAGQTQSPVLFVRLAPAGLVRRRDASAPRHLVYVALGRRRPRPAGPTLMARNNRKSFCAPSGAPSPATGPDLWSKQKSPGPVRFAPIRRAARASAAAAAAAPPHRDPRRAVLRATLDFLPGRPPA